MGQYYHPVDMELREHIYSHSLDCGLKMGEILGSCHRVCDAVAILLADSTSDDHRPGDLHVDGVTGRWAGHPVLYIGDYAAKGDLPSWRWEIGEEKLYNALRGTDEEGEPIDHSWDEISHLVRPVIERASGHVWVRGRGSVDLVAATPRDGGGYTVRIPDRANQYLRDSLEAVRPQVEARTDLTFLSAADVADGRRRLMVNLDKLEFVDPEAFGETPTLAGILAGMRAVFDDDGWSSLQAFNAMLFHNGSRGGGDEEGPMVGRWRGDRIVILGENGSDRFPTIDQVRDCFLDVSEEARANPLG